MDPIKTLRKLIQHEVGQERPSFTLLRTYLDALKEALARQRKVSVSDVSDADEGGLTLNAGHIAVGNAVVYGDNGPPRHRVARDSMEDNLLTAMDQMASRAGPDPLAALLQSIPAVESLYPEAEREAVRQRLRALVDRRLGTVPVVEEALPVTTRQALLTAGAAEEVAR